MTDEVKHLIDVMAMLDKCSETPCCKCEQLKFNDTIACSDEAAVYQHAAKLLEAFCAELEQVKRERDTMIEAVRDKCDWCKHFYKGHNGCTYDCDCDNTECKYVDGHWTGWQWCGVEGSSDA